MSLTANSLQDLAKEMMALSDKAGSAGETDISDTWCSASTMVSRLAMQTPPPKPAGAVPMPERPALPNGIRRETLTAPGSWTVQEAGVIRAYGDAREAAGRAVAVPVVPTSIVREYLDARTCYDAASKPSGSHGLPKAVSHGSPESSRLWSAREALDAAMLAAPTPQQPAAEGAAQCASAGNPVQRMAEATISGCVDVASQTEGAGREAEPNGKLVGWWNGMKGEDASIRWGADRENEYHDIPLYDGYNPIHYQTPTPAADAGGVTERTAPAAPEGWSYVSDGGRSEVFDIASWPDHGGIWRDDDTGLPVLHKFGDLKDVPCGHFHAVLVQVRPEK